ncbi:MAG: hypothetical protein JWO11_4146 [Nocardioides sp.]|nr:hypothetical protein [Nocardioides sp.]
MFPPGVIMQARDVVTPSEAAAVFGIPAATVRSWIRRKNIRPLGKIGPYNRYDYQELAELERDMRVHTP